MIFLVFTNWYGKIYLTTTSKALACVRYVLAEAHVTSLALLSTKASLQLNPGPVVIKLLLCSTELSMKFIMLINVKMSTIVSILTFIRINTTCEGFKA